MHGFVISVRRMTCMLLLYSHAVLAKTRDSLNSIKSVASANGFHQLTD